MLVHPTPFKEQPKHWQMGMITNDLKHSYGEPLPVTKILDYFANGHSIMLCDVETDQNNSFRFISSSLFAIDIDDDNYITDPEEITEKLKNEITGLFYTFSHGIKGNRYRLFYQLDRRVTDEREISGIIELVAMDLKKMGLPVDTQAKNPLQIVRGGKKSVLINAENKLNTDALLERVKAVSLKKQKELYNEFEKELRPVPFNSLKDMAEHIGHIPTGSGQGELWKRLVVGIKHYANAGYITSDQGFELFDIISGGEQPPKAWDKLKASGRATIKSFIYEALERGYKGKYAYYSNDDETVQDYNYEKIKVNKYIPIEVAKALIQSNQRILIDSPTGSGKTTQFVTAFKELATEKKHFYIFAAPTIALTDQIANNHKVRAIKGKTENLFKLVAQDVKNKQRVFISTYDMVPILVDFLETIDHKTKFTLIVDELHKFVTDYEFNYRFDAIQRLYELSKQAKTFIGLSGTVDDIYKNEFDKVIKIDNGVPQSPCQEFAIYTYEKRKDALIELTKLIEVWTSQRRLLIYIQSKDKIEQLQTVLRRKGIKVRTISASKKSNLTYKQLVETSTIDKNIQVVLTTSVIADGVSIENEGDIDWEVIAVCNDFSNLFNYSALKQISNRLRKSYRRFSLFMQEPKSEDQIPFKLESAYQHKISRANEFVEELNALPYFDLRLFRASTIEKRYGIYPGMYGLTVDSLFLRHSVAKEQERYYSKFRFAFINVVEKALHTKSAGILNVSEEIRKQRLELTFIQQVLEQLVEQKKEQETAKIENIAKEFNKNVYQAFLDDDEAILSEFKKNASPLHYSCLKRVTKIASYETCKIVVSKVKRKNEVNAYYDDIAGLVDACYMLSIHRPTKTRQAFLLLLSLTDFVTKIEFENQLTAIAKKIRVTIADVKGVKKMISFEEKRTKSERLKRVSGPITAEAIAKKYGLTVEAVIESAIKFAKKQSKTVEIAVRNQLIK